MLPYEVCVAYCEHRRPVTGPANLFLKKKEKEKGNGGTPDSHGVVRRYNRSIAVGLAPHAHVCVTLCASSFVMNHM